ncbi:MAG: GDSL-type esterase/lipase family protein [Candidatus Cloacimonetes bacterium]|nr:GDSL-type esterase/lipase family protein [Candidatus Cloacimonadota bacterium]
MKRYLALIAVSILLVVIPLFAPPSLPLDDLEEIEISEEFPVEIDCLEEFIQSYYELLESENYLKQFTFLNHEANRLHNPQPLLAAFFNKLMAVRNGANQPITIYQIGDSHIKPGYVSTTVRGSLLKFFQPDTPVSNALIQYHYTGINGASYTNLQSNAAIFEKIETLQPDLLIISLGTNDAQGRYNAANFRKAMNGFMAKVFEKQPNPTVIFGLPADCAKNGTHNTNVEKVAAEIMAYASERGFAWWNLYEVMGGSRSIFKWKQKDLASRDLIHFSPQGYMLQGYLFYHAMIHGYKAQTENGG